MAAEKLLGFSLAAGLALVCCGGPLLLVALGSLGLSAWAGQAGYVLIPVFLASVGLMGIWLIYATVPPHRSPLTAASSMSKHES